MILVVGTGLILGTGEIVRLAEREPIIAIIVIQVIGTHLTMLTTTRTVLIVITILNLARTMVLGIMTRTDIGRIVQLVDMQW